jgi:hypothetical protein
MQLASGLAQARLLHAHDVSPVGVRGVLEASMARDICHTLTTGIHKLHCQSGGVQSCLANGSPLFDPEDGVDEPVVEEESQEPADIPLPVEDKAVINTAIRHLAIRTPTSVIQNKRHWPEPFA